MTELSDFMSRRLAQLPDYGGAYLEFSTHRGYLRTSLVRYCGKFWTRLVSDYGVSHFEGEWTLPELGLWYVDWYDTNLKPGKKA